MPSAIEVHHADLLAQGLNLGEPASLETDTYDGGLAQVFEYGRIYFHPRLTSAFEVHGLILDRYVELGEEMSHLGYPTSDEMDDPFVLLGRMNTFEHGMLRFDPAVGVLEEFEPEDLTEPTRVIVKFEDEFDPLIPAGGEIGFDQLAALISPIPIIVQLSYLLGNANVRRCLHGVSDADLDALIVRAQNETPGYQPPNFSCFVEVTCPPNVEPDLIVTLANQLPGIVEFAYVKPEVEDASVVGTTNPLFPSQGYLSAANTGVNAPAAWAAGADGFGVGFFDIEQGWFLAHEDFPVLVRLLFGINARNSHLHGTAVLGIVLGQDNSRGIVGLAPNCDATIVSHRLPPGQDNRTRLAEVLVLTAIAAQRGDVILIEVEHRVTVAGFTQVLPVETARLEHEVVKMVVAAGLVVIEPAGNGSEDLDSFVDVLGLQMLNRTLPAQFRDSGAIFVGGSDTFVPHGREARSNFGSRVDVYAWGERIATTGDFDHAQQRKDAYLDANREFFPGVFGFGGTSGASAIIAGVCVLIQHLCVIRTHISGSNRLNCEQMRSLLTNPANGTASIDPAVDKIGLMPDFEAIITNEFIL